MYTIGCKNRILMSIIYEEYKFWRLNMKGITHQELYKSLSKLENISQDKAKKIMNTLLDILKENIENGNSINLKGIGTFSVIEKEPREAYDHFRNTKTKVPKRRYLKFKTSSNIKKYF